MINSFPTWCFECQSFITSKLRSDSPYLCCGCYRKLPLLTAQTCLKCGLFHSSDSCDQEWAQHISRFQAIFAYQDPIQKWISSLKYSRRFMAGRILRGFIKEWFDSNTEYLAEIDLLLSVPVHPLRLRHRGFNQTTYLLNVQRQFPLFHNLIKKTRPTPHQASLLGSARKRNLSGSFAVTKSLHGKNVLLFDDVCTTGQTIGEISKCLLSKGAERIDVLVLSRRI